MNTAQGNYLLFIPYVNRPDLLGRALAGVGDLSARTIIIDNSDLAELDPDGMPVKIFKPPVPLGFSQTQNLMQRMAFSAGSEFFFFLHSDAYCDKGDGEKFIEYASSLQGKKWGVIFTLYDAFCCFNTTAVREVGPWDWRALPWYHADSDYYRRLKLAGYTHEHIDLNVRHTPSQTRAADTSINMIVETQIKESESYYRAKWGGPPNHEIFDAPFNGENTSG